MFEHLIKLILTMLPPPVSSRRPKDHGCRIRVSVSVFYIFHILFHKFLTNSKKNYTHTCLYAKEYIIKWKRRYKQAMFIPTLLDVTCVWVYVHKDASCICRSMYVLRTCKYGMLACRNTCMIRFLRVSQELVNSLLGLWHVVFGSTSKLDIPLHRSIKILL